MAKIMIIEDDMTIANIYKTKLEEGGHQVTLVADKDAVKQIISQKPDLVLLDILMPNVNGLDILREVRSDALTSAIPIVLLTNVAEDDSLAKGLEYGAYGYLLKSETTPDQVLSRVNMTLDETTAPKP